MARSSQLTEEEVFPAIWQLFASGKHPQQTSLREALGNRGSPPVLQAFINDWHREFAPTLAALRDGKAPPAPATTELQDELKRLTQAAIEQMDAANAERSKALDDRERELEDAAAALQSREDDLMRRERAQQDREQAHQEFVEEMRAELRSARQERAAALDRAAEAASALAVTQQKLVSLEQAHEALSSEKNDLAASLATVTKANGAAEARIQELERYAGQLKEQLDRAVVAKEEAKYETEDVRTALQTEVDRLRAELADVQSDHAQTRRDLDSSREQAHAASQASERLRIDLDVCRDRLEAEGRARASAEAEAAVLKQQLASAEAAQERLSALQEGFEKLQADLASLGQRLPAEKPKRG